MGDWYQTLSGNKATASASSDPLHFTSRRSPFLCRKGCVATSQPLASSIGLSMLRMGANAADTAIAVAAALALTEPCSTGLGGDMFCLYYDASTKKVSAINGSGASPVKLNLDVLKRDCSNGEGGISKEEFMFSSHAVTVPGAAKGWEDLFKRHGSGKFSMAQLLEPAAQLADEGFPVEPIAAHQWEGGMPQITKWLDTTDETIPMTVDGKNAPKTGDIFTNPDLARVFRDLGNKGAQEGFYEGTTGKAIVDAIQKHGGTMTMQDLADHSSLFPEPISAQYRDVKLWQVPPNGQGVAALVALTGLQHLENKGKCPKISPTNLGSADAYHVEIEMMRLGFADARSHLACPNHGMRVTNEWLLSPDRIGSRAEELFDPTKAVIHGQPLSNSCTVSFQVVDEQQNAVSFVNSNYMGFGTGIVPEKCGFTLQNRGFGFRFDDPDHPNAVAGGKRPLHSIIPGMLTYADTDELYASLTNMGGNMQPQGHLQLTVDMVAGGLDPQAAIDMPRFCIADGTHGGTVFLEDGIRDDVLKELRERGHNMESEVLSGRGRRIFGRAQIIKRDRKTGVLWAGSDGRADGCAMGY